MSHDVDDSTKAPRRGRRPTGDADARAAADAGEVVAVDDAIREYGLACRIAGRDAWLIRLAESGGGVEPKLEAALARDRRAEDRVRNTYRTLLAEREEMLGMLRRLRALLGESR